MISCPKCGLEDLLEYSKNIDEVVLDFAYKFDKGKLSKNSLEVGLKQEGILRDENQIKKMIGKNKIDEITKQVLYSKKDYISQYKVLKNPEPKMGCKIEDLGLEDEITNHLGELGIKQFYKFQEESISEITFGENIVIEAPTASGKTEAFLIPVNTDPTS